jgi:phosphate starvation-inducible PhoH-like protein
LPIGIESGLKQAAKILKNISDIAFINFDENDIVRHPVVSKIVVAYDKEAKLSDARR